MARSYRKYDEDWDCLIFGVTGPDTPSVALAGKDQ